jgi:hypothetical protein
MSRRLFSFNLYRFPKLALVHQIGEGILPIVDTAGGKITAVIDPFLRRN